MIMRIKFFAILFISFHLPGISTAQKIKASEINNGIERPKLVVGLVIDQMRWDYLYRYYNRYGNNGFKRLLQKGYRFENTFIPYTPAVTAAGHACLYTGSVPAINGITGNDWMEKDSAYAMYCTADASVISIGTNSKLGRMSPRNLLTTTMGDELRLATNFKSRVYGLAMKDRGAILAAGHSANGVYWFDDSTGNWISSSYYMNELPGWVNRFNTGRRIDSLMGKNWELLYPVSAYDQSAPDDNPNERPLKHENKTTFPHVYKSEIGKNYYSFRESPYSNSFTLDFAKQLIENEKPGISGQTDMLCISLSATDFIGHRVAPNSTEMEDVYVRLDKDIEQFLKYLDVKLGTGNYLLFLSADHGAPQAPGFMNEHKLPGGRFKKKEIRDILNKYGYEKFAVNGLVKVIHDYQVYLDYKLIELLHLDTTEVKDAMVKCLESRPEVMYAFSYADFYKVSLPSRLKEMYARSYYPKRSGDIQFILKPQYTDQEMQGTDHGTPFAYDTHIPLVWYGWKIKPGRSYREVFMTDVAPTICSKLKIQMPAGNIGQVLSEIMD